MTDHYATLGIRRDAEFTVIEGAHRALIKRYHPDKNLGDATAAERAKAVNAAFDVLKDPDTRARYDRELPPERADHASSTTPPPPPPRQSPPPPPRSRPASPQPIRPQPAAGGPSAALLSLGFIGLAVLVGVGAVGSLTQSGATEPVTAVEPAAAEALASQTTTTRSRPAPTAADRQSSAVEKTLQTSEAASKDPCGDINSGLPYWLCADPAVAAADQRLKAVYADQLRKAPNPATLEADQDQWRVRRDAIASDRNRLLRAYEARIETLLASDLEGLY